MRLIVTQLLQYARPTEYAGYVESLTVDRVIKLVDAAEHKRRQSPPGPKITGRAFGRDRRLPITSRWRETAAPTAPEPLQSRPDAAH